MKRSLKTKLLTILLSLAMLFTMMPTSIKTVNAEDPTIIDTIKFTITPPAPGVEVEVTGDDKESQTPRPVINIPDNAPFALNDNGIYWVTDEEELFKEKFVDGQEYYVIMILKANEGYKFANEPSFGTNCDVLNYSHVADDRNLIEVYAKIKCQPNQTTHTVTYNIVNGTLSDGTSTSTTETVEHGKKPSSIPTNLIPKQGYEAGSWDPDPTNATITEPTVYTYTFTKIPVKEIQLNIDKKASNLIGAQESSIYFGKYKQSFNGEGGFINEPIKWRVLSNEKNKETNTQELFILTDQVIDTNSYHTKNEDITWEDSYIRKCLNIGEYSFLSNAFSTFEQGIILESKVINDDNPYSSITGGNNTQDKVFLLSLDEISDLGNNDKVDEKAYGFTSDSSRLAKATDYAIAKEVRTWRGYPAYWLRTPGESKSHVTFVRGIGDIYLPGDEVVDDLVGVRPAVKISTESIAFTSDAGGGKAQSSLGLKEVSETTTTNWKLTLLDETRKFEAKLSGTQKDSYKSGDTLSFTYIEAKTEDNEYISAIITDDKDNVLYYGRLLQPTSATSTSETLLNVTLPDLEDGNYKLRIFNEQYNGGDEDNSKLTDYASKFSTTEFTIGQAPVTQYTIKFVDDDGTELQSSDWAEGSTPYYSGSTPTKSPDAQYTYRFIGWTPVIAKVTGGATYKATYASTLREYTVKFVDEDGTELQSSQVNYGETPYYTGEMPTKQADAQYTYTFAGWNPAISPVIGDATYTATYMATPIPVTVTYKTTAGDNGTWTKGDTKTLDFTFKRSEDDNEDTYKTHFKHIEIDGNKVDNDKYSIGYGSIIIKLKPELLNNLSTGDYTLKIVFDDGSSTANFTIKEKGNNNNNNKPYIIPKTGVE